MSFVSPGKLGAGEAAARRELPLGFSWQRRARPFGIGLGISVCDVHDWMIVKPPDRAAFAQRASPVGAKFERPPVRVIGKVYWMIGRSEDKRTRLEHTRQRTWIIRRIGGDLGKRDVASRLDEPEKSPVGDWCAINPETIDADAMDRPLVGIMLVRAHLEGAAGDKHHTRRDLGG